MTSALTACTLLPDTERQTCPEKAEGGAKHACKPFQALHVVITGDKADETHIVRHHSKTTTSAVLQSPGLQTTIGTSLIELAFRSDSFDSDSDAMCTLQHGRTCHEHALGNYIKKCFQARMSDESHLAPYPRLWQV